MATTPALLSIEQYLRTSYHPDADFVDGEIEERNLGEYEHAKLQALITAFFTNKEDDWKIDTVVEQRIRVSTRRVRICDVALLRAEAPHEHVTATPPFICIEVMSPEDRLSRAKVVLADYLAMGVPNIWLIDPIRRVAYTFDANGLQDVPSLKLHVAGTPVELDVAAAFAKLDKKSAQPSDL